MTPDKGQITKWAVSDGDLLGDTPALMYEKRAQNHHNFSHAVHNWKWNSASSCCLQKAFHFMYLVCLVLTCLCFLGESFWALQQSFQISSVCTENIRLLGSTRVGFVLPKKNKAKLGQWLVCVLWKITGKAKNFLLEKSLKKMLTFVFPSLMWTESYMNKNELFYYVC